jgi:uncharacterized protein HemX
MVPNVSVRTYKPRQQSFSKEKYQARSRVGLKLSGEQRKIVAALSALVVVLGLALTQFLHGQITDMRVKAEKLQEKNTVTADEHVRLLAARAQLTSKTKVAVLAGTKLHLFEPDKGQVRRM